jgi:hypothetical protein
MWSLIYVVFFHLHARLAEILIDVLKYVSPLFELPTESFLKVSFFLLRSWFKKCVCEMSDDTADATDESNSIEISAISFLIID